MKSHQFCYKMPKTWLVTLKNISENEIVICNASMLGLKKGQLRDYR